MKPLTLSSRQAAIAHTWRPIMENADEGARFVKMLAGQWADVLKQLTMTSNTGPIRFTDHHYRVIAQDIMPRFEKTVEEEKQNNHVDSDPWRAEHCFGGLSNGIVYDLLTELIADKYWPVAALIIAPELAKGHADVKLAGGRVLEGLIPKALLGIKFNLLWWHILMDMCCTHNAFTLLRFVLYARQKLADTLDLGEAVSYSDLGTDRPIRFNPGPPGAHLANALLLFTGFDPLDSLRASDLPATPQQINNLLQRMMLMQKRAPGDTGTLRLPKKPLPLDMRALAEFIYTEMLDEKQPSLLASEPDADRHHSFVINTLVHMAAPHTDLVTLVLLGQAGAIDPVHLLSLCKQSLVYQSNSAIPLMVLSMVGDHDAELAARLAMMTLTHAIQHHHYQQLDILLNHQASYPEAAFIDFSNTSVVASAINCNSARNIPSVYRSLRSIGRQAGDQHQPFALHECVRTALRNKYFNLRNNPYNAYYQLLQMDPALLQQQVMCHPSDSPEAMVGSEQPLETLTVDCTEHDNQAFAAWLQDKEDNSRQSFV